MSSPRRLGSWDVLEPAGVGSQSTVYLARPASAKPGTIPDYAIKILNETCWREEQAVIRFGRESQCGSKTSHPNLATTLMAQCRQTPPYLVMPRLKGHTLRQRLDAGPRIAIAQTLWIMRQIASGLESLHKGGWIHGDIKPSNIMLGYNGHATLFDFGFAQRIREANRCDRDPFCGTLRYTAPELLTSTRTASPASDVYAFGATLYELLTGQPPFACKRPESLAESHLRIPAPSVRTALPNLPRSVAKAVAAMLAKDPLRRPSSFSELTDLLLRLEIETFSLREGCHQDAFLTGKRATQRP